LEWPLPQLEDKIRHRADNLAENSVSHAIIFGAHFRWDFMPLWMNLHDMFAFISDELHQRNIKLFDHHSAVLTHRYNDCREMAEMRMKNRHHVPFAPTREVAEMLSYNGKKLNDWRMLDVITGKPAYPGYTAEIFCINNPDFSESYYSYVKKLVAETKIDGLEADDGLYYPRFYACGCQYCREKFKMEYDHLLPPGDDLSFWGNWENQAFKDWIQMRHISVGEFLRGVRNVLPEAFPLMTCCSGSSDSAANETSCSYENFMEGCNTVMLEMCGNTPALDGGLTHSLASQMHHLAVARQHKVPCIGLGYGYTEAQAGMVWAFNKWLGSDTWFSTLKGRLGMKDKDMGTLPDDSELVGVPFGFEKVNPEWFNGESQAIIAILFSKKTRDNYGGYMADYAHDYIAACRKIFEAGYDAVTVLEIPAPESACNILVIPSAACFSESDKAALKRWLDSGKTIIANGPFGVFDENAECVEKQFADDFGLHIELPEIVRAPKFPHDTWEKREPARCVNEEKWHKLDKNFYWNPVRMQDMTDDSLFEILSGHYSESDITVVGGRGWYVRKFRDDKGRIILHAIAAEYELKMNEELEAKRAHIGGNNIITEIIPKNNVSVVNFKLMRDFRKIEFATPLCSDQITSLIPTETLSVTVPEGCYYFILRLAP
ncbi:MAG: hypothetical protein WCP55_18475, partial [Lentisphaerota bacterium]